jgi:thioredoxin-dependent peroxiredoxin
MRLLIGCVIVLVIVVIAIVRPVRAQLAPKTAAPKFTAQVAQGGNISSFSLAAALEHGPVILYFFPKAFTAGCTAEAHDFADHIAEYKALGATVVGVSGDSIETQQKFSTQECRSKFLVASDPGLKIAKSYHAVVLGLFANRTSYVIAPDGTIAYTYTSLDPDKHVANTLAALRELRRNARD